MGIVTQRDSVRTKVGNLSLLSGIRIISGNAVQAYDNDKGEWEPDRSLVPLVMLPYIQASDPDNVQSGGQALTGVEWYEGVPKKDFGNRIVAGNDYKIGDGTEGGIPKYALVVMKNTPAGTAADIYCIAKFTDNRVGQTRNVTLSVTLRTSTYQGANYTLRLDCPKDVEIDPMRETQWVRTATAQLYCGTKAVDDAHAAYWWQTGEGNGEWKDITADDGRLWAECMANGVYTKTLKYDARMFEGVVFRVRAAYYEGKRPAQPSDAALKAEFMVNVRVRDSITAQMYKTKGLKMAYDFSTNVGFKVRVFDNAKAFDDDKVAEMTRVAWKGHSRKAGSQPVALDSGVDVAFVPKDKGFDKAYGVDVSAEVKLYRKHVVLTDDDGKYLTDFEQHLRKSGKRTNTVGKHMRQLRTIINEAINHGIIKADDYPFKKYKIKSERGHFEWLTPQELRRLENLKLTNKGQRHILDAFLFCCYTGLRYSDFVRMKPDWIEKINGKPWLHFFTKKTNTEVRLPLSLLFDGKALSIIGKYGDIGKLAHIYGNHDTNVALSHIMEAAKIGKRATFHMARHNKNYIYLNMK